MCSTPTNIIIPVSSDCHMSDPSDPFAAADPIPNSFPLSSTENELSQEGNLEQLELSPNKRYALWRKDAVEYWNPWWHQVLNSSKTDDKFGYFSWTNRLATVRSGPDRGLFCRPLKKTGPYSPAPPDRSPVWLQ